MTDDDEREAVGLAVRDFMDRTEGILDEDTTWRRLAAELDLQGIAQPERWGGSEASPSYQLPVLIELGRSLRGARYLSTILMSVGAIVASGDEQSASELVPGAIDGTTSLALAVAERRLAWREDDIAATATRDGDGYLLNGAKIGVVGAAGADALLVAARSEEGVGLYATARGGEGVAITPLETLDPTRDVADVVLDAAPARLIGSPEGWSAVVWARDAALVGIAAEALGGIEALCEMTVLYAKDRVQFGVPIGSFQAVKHRIADMVVAAREARRGVEVLERVLDAGGDLGLAAGAVHARIADAYLSVAESAIQVHGGIGFTAEHAAHKYLKRAWANRLLLGSPVEHRERAADLLGV